MRQQPARTISVPSGRRSFPRSGYTLTEMMIVLAILASIAGISWPALMRPWSRSLAQQAAQQLTEQLLEARTRAVEESRVYRMRWRAGTSEFQIDAPFGDATDLPLEPAGGLPAAAGDTAREAPPKDRAEAPADNNVPTESDVSSEAGNNLGDSLNPTPKPRPAALQVLEQLDNGVKFPAAAPVLTVTEDSSEQTRSQETTASPGPVVPPLSALPFGNEVNAETTSLAEWSEPIWFYPDGRTSNGRWTLVSDDGYEIDVLLRGLTGTIRIGRVRPVQRIEGPDGLATDDTTAAEAASAARPAATPDVLPSEQP